MKASLIILTLIISFVNAWFEKCNNKFSLPTTNSSFFVSENYPKVYPNGSSCKWYLTVPTGYTVNLTCTYNVATLGDDCQSQRVYVSRDGDKDLNYANYYCGYSSFTMRSVGNEISFGYTSNTNGNGWLYCEAKAVLTTQENCNCGWNKNVSHCKSSEFMSHKG